MLVQIDLHALDGSRGPCVSHRPRYYGRPLFTAPYRGAVRRAPREEALKEVILTAAGYEKLRQEISIARPRSAARSPNGSASRASSATSPRTRNTTTQNRAGDARAPDAARGAAALGARDHQEGGLGRLRLGWLHRAPARHRGEQDRRVPHRRLGRANPSENRALERVSVGKAIMGAEEGRHRRGGSAARVSEFKILEIKAA